MHTSSKTTTLTTIFLSALFLILLFKVHRLKANDGYEKMVPQVLDEGKMVKMMMMYNDNRRKLNSFQICSICTCCSSSSENKNYCLPSPCCYAINCNIPNRPFGFCSFTPKTCNCFGCHI